MEKKNNLSLIIVISLILFSIKWIYSFINFPNEEIILKVISEAISDSYFHYVKVLSEFNFNNDYLLTNNEYLLLVPIGSVIFHSIIYKIIGIFSFIILEFIFIFLFIYLFSSIFLKFDFDNNFQILLSLILFSIPLFILINNEVGFINNFISIFFNLRFPRPLVTNIYLFFFLYFIINNYKQELFTKKNIYILAIFFSLLISSSFFIFLPLFMSLLIYYFNKKEYQDFINKMKYLKLHIFFSSLIFIFLSIIFLYLVEKSNSDYLSRMGIIKLTFDENLLLFKYYFENIIKNNFLLLIFMPSFIYILIKKYFTNSYTYIVDIFFINYACSLISPFILTLFSSKIAFINHINNLIIINLFLFIFIAIIYIYKNLLIKNNFIFPHKKFIYLSIIILIFLNFLKPTNSIYLDEKIKQIRLDKNQIINEIKTINKDCSILTFDNSIMTFLILDGFKNLPYLNGTFANRSDEILENNLINSLKLLNINRQEFREFMSSSWDGWRLRNSNMQQLFWQKYQANSFYTYQGSMDFKDSEIQIIKKTSPSIIHQVVLPNYEIQRLLNKYDAYSKIRFNDFIIIDKNNKFWSDKKNTITKYELYLENKNFKIYKKKKFNNCLNS